MLLTTVEDPAGRSTLLAGLPGSPQSAIIALLTLVAPALAGLTGRDLPRLPAIELGAPIPGRAAHTCLALVSRGPDDCAYPVITPHRPCSAAWPGPRCRIVPAWPRR